MPRRRRALPLPRARRPLRAVPQLRCRLRQPPGARGPRLLRHSLGAAVRPSRTANTSARSSTTFCATRPTCIAPTAVRRPRACLSPVAWLTMRAWRRPRTSTRSGSHARKRLRLVHEADVSPIVAAIGDDVEMVVLNQLLEACPRASDVVAELAAHLPEPDVARRRVQQCRLAPGTDPAAQLAALLRLEGRVLQLREPARACTSARGCASSANRA